MRVDIITCTYNRGNLLEKLYKSLVKQTCNKFTWIIIDDGSEDNTKDIVEKFTEQEKIKIEYYKIKNGGKHVALNKAIEVSKNELFFIVDSDDILVENSIEEIIRIEKTIENKKEFCGLAGIKATFEGKSLTNELKQNIIDANSIDAMYKYNLFGDKAEVFYSNILKKYRFPAFENEKFITESVVWNRMANDGYKIRWFNRIIYLAEYRDDGLTQNSFRLAVENPKGKSYYHNLESDFNIPLKWKIYHQINYFRYGFIAKNNVIELIRDSRKKIFIPISIPIALLGILYTFYKCKKMDIKLT